MVMGNDFPDAVFSTEEAARAFCEQQLRADREEDARNGRRSQIPRIYWRVWDYELDAKSPKEPA